MGVAQWKIPLLAKREEERLVKLHFETTFSVLHIISRLPRHEFSPLGCRSMEFCVKVCASDAKPLAALQIEIYYFFKMNTSEQYKAMRVSCQLVYFSDLFNQFLNSFSTWHW